jgi:hypothetical protein
MSAIGTAEREARTSRVRVGWTMIARPAALTPVTTPVKPGHPTPAHA